jgi:hypothetical protein
MNEEQKDVAVGRVLRERKEIESHLAALEEKARTVSQRLADLAEMLDRSPQDTWFHGQSASIKGYPPRSASFNIADYNMQQVVDLTNEIRDTRERLDRLNSEASALGF